MRRCSRAGLIPSSPISIVPAAKSQLLPVARPVDDHLIGPDQPVAALGTHLSAQQEKEEEEQALSLDNS